MKRCLLSLFVIIVLLAGYTAASAAENAAITVGPIPLMAEPSFISDEIEDVLLHQGQRLEVLSRTSFTDRLAAIPEDYWYLVRYRESDVVYSGYVHGSALALDTAATVPVFDPPGFAPEKPAASGGKTVTASIDVDCTRRDGTVIVPGETMATHFVIKRFDSSFTPCPAGGYASIIGFSIVPAADTGNELFSYEEHIADDPAELQYTKDGFYYFDLEPGTYTVTVRGGKSTVLVLGYELTDNR